MVVELGDRSGDPGRRGMRIASDVSYDTFALFSITHVPQQLELESSLVLDGVLVASVFQLVAIPAIPAFASLSDRVGRADGQPFSASPPDTGSEPAMGSVDCREGLGRQRERERPPRGTA